MTERAAFIGNVQVLRGVAALMVVAVHSIDVTLLLPRSTLAVPAQLENFGSAGVDLFFVISGFIIASTAFGSVPRKPLDFARQRFWRVVPLYLLLSLPYLLTSPDMDLGMLVATVLFWPATYPYSLSAPLMLIGWTLCFEMLFYAAAALVLVRPGRGMVAAVLLAYGVCWVLAEVTNLSAFRFLGNPLCVEFLMGVLIARLAPRLPGRMGSVAVALGVTWFAVMIVLGLEGRGFPDPEVWTRLLVWGMPAALIVLGAVIMKPWTAPGMAPLLGVGAASYSIYLAHPLALWLLDATLRGLGPQLGGYGVLALCLGASVGVGILVHRCIEQPLLEFGRTARLRPAPAAP